MKAEFEDMGSRWAGVEEIQGIQVFFGCCGPRDSQEKSITFRFATTEAALRAIRRVEHMMLNADGTESESSVFRCGDGPMFIRVRSLNYFDHQSGSRGNNGPGIDFQLKGDAFVITGVSHFVVSTLALLAREDVAEAAKTKEGEEA